MRTTRLTRSIAISGAALALLSGTVACSSAKSASNATGGGPVTVRLGYFPNVTHGTAIVGLAKGIYAQALGSNTLKATSYADGTVAAEAINSGALDATYIGSGPAINLFQRSHGAIRIIAGATSGGASFVVQPDINSAKDLVGKTVASPKLGNTQDVSLRAWLKSQGEATTTSGGGDVKIVPQDNAQALDAFRAGRIAGAWEPEPWATRLVKDGGGKVLVDERDLFPGRQFATTNLIVTTSFLRDHPDVVKQLVQGHVLANEYINAHSVEAKALVNAGIKKLTGKDLKPPVIDGAWQHLEFTDDPLAASLVKAAKDARAAGLLKSSDVSGIYDLSILDAVLGAAGKPAVKGL